MWYCFRTKEEFMKRLVSFIVATACLSLLTGCLDGEYRLKHMRWKDKDNNFSSTPKPEVKPIKEK